MRPRGFLPVACCVASRFASLASYSACSAAYRSAAPLNQLRLGLLQRLESLFASGQLRRNIQGCLLGSVGRFRPPQQFLHLSPQLLLQLKHVSPAQEARCLEALALTFVPSRLTVPNFKKPHLMGQQQNLHKQRLQLLQKALAEVGNRIVIGMGVGSDIPKGHRIIRRLFQLAARVDPGGIAVKQQSQQHRWRIGRRATTGIGVLQGPQIQLPEHLHDESRQVVLWKPFLHRRWKQKGGLSINRSKSITHTPTLSSKCDLSGVTYQQRGKQKVRQAARRERIILISWSLVRANLLVILDQ